MTAAAVSDMVATASSPPCPGFKGSSRSSGMMNSDLCLAPIPRVALPLNVEDLTTDQSMVVNNIYCQLHLAREHIDAAEERTEVNMRRLQAAVQADHPFRPLVDGLVDQCATNVGNARKAMFGVVHILQLLAQAGTNFPGREKAISDCTGALYCFAEISGNCMKALDRTNPRIAAFVDCDPALLEDEPVRQVYDELNDEFNHTIIYTREANSTFWWWAIFGGAIALGATVTAALAVSS